MKGVFPKALQSLNSGISVFWFERRIPSRFRAFGKCVFVRLGLAWLANVDRASVDERESGGDEVVVAEQAAVRLPITRDLL